MESRNNWLDVSNLTREEKLRIWMALAGETYSSIARKVWLEFSSVKYLLENKTISIARYEDFRNLGIPEDVLPPAKDLKPGPKKRALVSSVF